MLLARFEFKPEIASYFCENGQTVREVTYPCMEDLISSCKEIEDALVDCTVFDGYTIYNLKACSH